MAENGSGYFLQDGILGMLSRGLNLAQAEEAFELGAQEILAYAQDNAPWADRTGDARAGLGVVVEHSSDALGLSLYHSVDYGLWLETIQNGRFAIIMPTLELFAQQIFEDAGGRITESAGGF